jgi:hypothetical protein
MIEPLYFGCGNGAGHYVWDRYRANCWTGPLSEFLRKNDGKLAPTDGNNRQHEGEAALTTFHGGIDGAPETFTVLAFWDRSVDSRMNSNSMFLLPGVLSRADAIAQAKEAFPWVFKRIKFEVH